MMENTHPAARLALATSLTKRMPTWAVAKHIVALGIIDKQSKLYSELKRLSRAASWSGNQMPDDFDRIDPADTQLATFETLFPLIAVDPARADDAAYLHSLIRQGLDGLAATAFVNAQEALIHRRRIDWRVGSSSSEKAFIKRVRFLKGLEDKADRLSTSWRLRNAQMQAKSRLAYMVDADACDDLTLAFCTYLAARANRRSMFMLGGQSKAFDSICQGLLKLMEESEDTAWDQAALVYPTKHVIERLEAGKRGSLIGLFHAQMTVAAKELSDLYPHLPERMRKEMVMVKGVDSSSWNAYAGALNTMRSAWISAVLAAGLDEILDSYCPGKCPRLMAADVVWWSRSMGQDLHEDTRMFSALPLPWDVVEGRASMDRDKILEVAKKLKVDAQASGWVSPRAPHVIEAAKAEPALVHGVAVSDPALAKTLRRCGVFSSKQLRHLDALAELELERALEVDGDRVTSTATRA